MVNSINTKHLPIKDLVVSSLIVFVISSMIAKIYNPYLGFIYAFTNVVTLTFLRWLYQDSWNPKQ